jgi:hypothetical protein
LENFGLNFFAKSGILLFMVHFDVSKDWVILVPPEPAAAQKAGADLARIIGLLREQAGLPSKTPALAGAFQKAPDDDVPVILFNSIPDKDSGNGFSWRLGMNRLEVHGASGRGLCDGVYDFLAALAVRWPRPGREELPDPVTPNSGVYPLESAAGRRQSGTDPAKIRRLVITGKTPFKNREQAVLWAARNRIDAVALPLDDPAPPLAGLTGKVSRTRGKLLSLMKDYALAVEAGGWELSLLVPRKNFVFHREMFRMEEGKRLKQYNFCPTNPDTTAVIKREAERYFRQNPEAAVFHLWPDRNHELTWCSCPTCRAFTREEQNRIAVNTAADVLAETAPQSRVSYYENGEEECGIPPRPNMFALRRLPGEAGAEEDGLYLAETIERRDIAGYCTTDRPELF